MSRDPATILVLEENAAVREPVDQALREAGHRMSVAACLEQRDA